MRWHVVASDQKAHAMLPPAYVQGATNPTPSPTYTYRPGGTGLPVQHPPIHAIFLAPRGKFIASLGRFCLAEAPASEWPFDDAPVPWILPESYRNPKGTVLDFPGSTVQDDADHDEGFKMVGDDEEGQGDRVLVSIPVKAPKPGDSGFEGKEKMFNSKEDDDSEMQEQIQAALASTGLLGELQLSESEDESKPGPPGSNDDEGDPNETKQYFKGQEEGAVKDPGLIPDSSIPTAVTDPPTVPGNPRDLDGSNPGAPAKDTQPTKPKPSKGKGPSSERSGKAPASKSSINTQPSAAAQGVQEHAQSILFEAATLIQATGTEEDTVRWLDNYTGLLTGLQHLAVTMASGYEAATEDIQSLVASTLDMATQQDCAFIAGASQALANWTEKYQQAMSQGENQSLYDQLARWDQVLKARITLSQEITSLTTDYEPSAASSKIFQTLLPDCFRCIRA